MIVPIYSTKDYQYQLNYLPYRYRFKHLKKKMLPFTRHKLSTAAKQKTHINHHIRPAPFSYSQPQTQRQSNNPDHSCGDEEERIQSYSIDRNQNHQENYRNAQLAAVALRHRRVEQKRGKILWQEGQDQDFYPYFQSTEQQHWQEGKNADTSINKIQSLSPRKHPEEMTDQRQWSESGWRALDKRGLLAGSQIEGKLSSELFGQKLTDSTIRSSLKVEQQEEEKYKNGKSDNTMTSPSVKGASELIELLSKPQSPENHDEQTLIPMERQKKPFGHSQESCSHQQNRYRACDPYQPLESAFPRGQQLDCFPLELFNKIDQNDLWTPIKQKNISSLQNEKGQKSLAKKIPENFQRSTYSTKYNLYRDLKASKEKELRNQREKTFKQYTQKVQDLGSVQKQYENVESKNKLNCKTYKKSKIQLIMNQNYDEISKEQIGNPPYNQGQYMQEDKTSKTHVKAQRSTNRVGFKANDRIESKNSRDGEIVKDRKAYEDSSLEKRFSQRDVEEGISEVFNSQLHEKYGDLKDAPLVIQRKHQRDEFLSQQRRSLQAKKYTSPSKVDKDIDRIWSFSDLISEDEIGLINSKPASSRINEDNNFQEDSSHPINMLRFSQPFKQLNSGKSAQYAQSESARLDERRSEVKSCEQDHLLKMIGGSDNLKQVSSLRLDSNQSGAWNQQALKEELSYFLKANRLPQQSPISLSQQPSIQSSTFRFERHEVDFNLMEALRNDGLMEERRRQMEERRRQEESQNQQYRYERQNGLSQNIRGCSSEFEDNRLMNRERLVGTGNQEPQEEALFSTEFNRESNRFDKRMEIIQQSEENYFPSTSTSRAHFAQRSISDYRNHFHPMRQALQKFRKSTSTSISAKTKSAGVRGYPKRGFRQGPAVGWNRVTGELQRERTRKQINLTRFKTRINHF